MPDHLIIRASGVERGKSDFLHLKKKEFVEKKKKKRQKILVKEFFSDKPQMNKRKLQEK